MLTGPLQSLRYPGGGQRRLITGIAERVEGGRAPSGLVNIVARSSRIVAFGRPGGEDHDDTSTTITCDAVALARLEREQRSWPRVNDVAARLDPRRSLDHHQPGRFANLVVAQLLTGAEADDDRPRSLTLSRTAASRPPARPLPPPPRGGGGVEGGGGGLGSPSRPPPPRPPPPSRRARGGESRGRDAPCRAGRAPGRC